MVRNPLLPLPPLPPLLLILFALPATVTAQTRLPKDLPDSITVEDNAWNPEWSYADSYTLVKDDNGYTVVQNSSSYAKGRRKSVSTDAGPIGYVTNTDIRGLIRAIVDTGFPVFRFKDLDVDSLWIARHSDRLFAHIKHRYDDWTPRQIAFTKKELSDYSNYDPAARRAILREGEYMIAKDYAVNFRLRFYYGRDTALTLVASENYLGLPWQIGNRLSYNPAISRAITSLLPTGFSSNLKRLMGERLIPLLASEVFEDKCQGELPALAVLEYTPYMNELKKDFTLEGASEVWVDWPEFKKSPQTFRFTLQHPSLHPGIHLQFYAIRRGHSLYPIDSLRQALPGLRNRIQGIPFLMHYLDENPHRRLNLMFFDHLAINREQIDEFNKDSSRWKIHDSWVKSMDMYKSGEIKPGFDIAKSIETSKEVECGCNFRFDNTWLQQSIVFELRDEFDRSSTWVLLPDNTPVLWRFQGDSVYKYSYHDLGTDGKAVQWPCKKLDANGNLLPAK